MLSRQAFFLIGAVIALHKAILLRMVRIAHTHSDPQTLTEAHQRRGEIAAVGAAHKAHIAIKGQLQGTTVDAQQAGHLLQGGLRVEVCSHLGLDQDRGAHINGVEHFDHMPLLAIGLGRHTGGIFEVHLPLAHGRRTLQRLPQVRQGPTDASGFAQEAINGATGARQALPTGGQFGITRQIIQQGFGSRRPSQAFRGLITQFKNALNHVLADAFARVLARPRLASQDALILRRRFAQAFAPLLDPAQRHAQRLGILLACPGRVQTQQPTQIGAGGVVYCFHVGTLLGRRRFFFQECTCLLPSLSTMWGNI